MYKQKRFITEKKKSTKKLISIVVSIAIVIVGGLILLFIEYGCFQDKEETTIEATNGNITQENIEVSGDAVNITNPQGDVNYTKTINTDNSDEK